MLIEKIPSLKDCMRGQTVILTGAGGGIGYEAAKCFAYMGANTIIAEIDRNKGEQAERQINDMFGQKLADFYEVDLSDKNQISNLSEYIMGKYGCPDIIFNNATITKMGAVDEVSLDFWDLSYAVNLRAPLILAQKFIPEMKRKNHGTIVFVSSSGASPYMGAYEVFKTAQVELSSTLAMELEEKDVFAYTIGPGLVKTKTAMDAIDIVASKMGMTTEEFYHMNSQHILDVESAGTGFALSTVKAAEYSGQEISSIQVLMNFDLMGNGTNNCSDEGEKTGATQYGKAYQLAAGYMKKIYETFSGQYEGWKAMNIFERQWVMRDFKKFMSLSGEQAYNKLTALIDTAQGRNFRALSDETVFFIKLNEYWKHQLKLLQGFEKNKNKLEENTRIINGWISDIDEFLKLFDNK